MKLKKDDAKNILNFFKTINDVVSLKPDFIYVRGDNEKDACNSHVCTHGSFIQEIKWFKNFYFVKNNYLGRHWWMQKIESMC